ncbi:MAG: formyltetrahydrofolate deformylase [Marinoscillum sp.]|jgi:formyltetrahydrofolate deformylase
MFFMRVEWELDSFDIPKKKVAEAFTGAVATQYAMEWQLFFTEKKPNMAVFVSKATLSL